MRARSTVRKKSSRARITAPTSSDHGSERNQERGPAQVASIGERENERAAGEPEEPAPRERRQLDDEQEDEQRPREERAGDGRARA